MNDPAVNSNQLFFALLRSAMTGEGFEATPTADEWVTLYQMAWKQSLTGVVRAFSRVYGQARSGVCG